MQQFKSYRKTTPTTARVLTHFDYLVFQGRIQTHEGPSGFLPGDFLAKDSKGMWPIPVEIIRANYEFLEATDPDGYGLYQPLDTRLAMQMEDSFEADGLPGKAGDYLVRSGKGEWPVDRELFEASYKLVEEEETHAD